MSIIPICVLAFLLYWPCLRGEFVFDDFAIKNMERVGAGDWRRVLRESIWRNVTLASYALNVRMNTRLRLARWNPVLFHAINILLHGINGSLVFWIAQSIGMDWHLAILASVFFIGAPHATSAVANIAGRGSVLSATVALVAILVMLSGHPMISVPLMLMAFFCKEDMAILAVTMATLGAIHGQAYYWLYLLLPVAGLIKWQAIQHQWKGTRGHEMEHYGFSRAFPLSVHLVTSFTEHMLRFPAWIIGLRLNVDPDIKPISWKSLRFILAVIIAAVIVLPIRYFLFQPFIVRGDSMVPNFHSGDYLIVDEISYRFGSPQRTGAPRTARPQTHGLEPPHEDQGH